MRRSIVMHSRATTGGVRPNVKENGQLRPSNAIPDAWKAGSRPYREFGLPASSENAYPRASSGGIWGIPVKINLRTGRWADFATDDRGGDPVSLVAFLEDVSQPEAARRLARMLGLDTREGGRHG
jgi:hypothetical protein